MVVDLLRCNYMATVCENRLSNILQVLRLESKVHPTPFLVMSHTMFGRNVDRAGGHVMVFFFVSG
jgi:hypothetical protein